MEHSPDLARENECPCCEDSEPTRIAECDALRDAVIALLAAIDPTQDMTVDQARKIGWASLERRYHKAKHPALLCIACHGALPDEESVWGYHPTCYREHIDGHDDRCELRMTGPGYDTPCWCEERQIDGCGSGNPPHSGGST